MGKNWHILFCDKQLHGCPVTEFIEACEPRHQVKVIRFLSLLEDMGPTLPRPYADLLRDGIHELRIRLSGAQVRLLYFFCHERFIILYHGFVKRSGPVPERFIRKVISYRDDLLQRVRPMDLEAMVDGNL